MSQGVRSALSAVLIVFACLLAPLGALSTWAMYGLGDSGRYEATMAPLASDTDVRDAIASGVTDGILREVHVRPRLQGPVNHFVRDAVRSFTETEAYRTAWQAANMAAHDAVMRALREDREGAVTVDLAPVTERVKRQLADDHMPLANRIPVEHTEITVLAAEDLAQLRKGFHVLEVAGFWLPVGAVVFALAGILVAVCRRRAVLATGLGTALGAAFLGVAVAVGRRLTLADLPPDVSRTAAGAVYDALTETLRFVSWLLLALGLAVSLTAVLTGAYARYRRASGELAQAPAEQSTRVRA
ncbi:MULTISPECIES: hypothetical protein [unclassified Streptomyces]|uniref:hypothetical protein n=1 Tax=unclassified Streptomyces TaxID=2593676 RepID=UPI002E811B70|nr:hypothetical protein [Streptomyces sp. NBC_00589]WTI37801.1 hypothetical protein OIC96_23725 [Streptomyces sp. NBC_00775]WUB28520.1 hypothetical protein OHA51_26010 [Streptomyces sp. NBC_00589]